ncbi:MAG: radical SAM protein [Rhodospirillaceae bacterium]|nr:radical SAM protein [Rhodospirillaceae bacterium]
MERPPRDIYVKSNSFETLAGHLPGGEEALHRIADLMTRLPEMDLPPDRLAVVDKACRALTGDATEGEPTFELKVHICEEIRHISDADLARYLFYRYRYDVYPEIKRIDAFPPCVQIEPTSICNYRCVFCYQTDKSFTQGRHGHMGMMSLDTFKSVVDQIEGEVEAVTLASRGEPLMCRGIGDMLSYLEGKFLGLKMNTNAWFLTEDLAHRILQTGFNTLVFSVDAAEPELYARLRVNGQLERVLANIKMFAEIRRKHYPDSQIITRASGVHFSDEQDFSEMQGFWSEYVDQVAFVDYNPWENVYDTPPRDITTPCSDLWRRMFIWWDGKANPCDVDYKSHLCAGTVDTTDISAIWRGESYQRLRDQHLAGNRQAVAPCASCAVI